MPQKVNKVEFLGRNGKIGVSDAGNWDFIYRASTVKDPKWNVGDRAVLPDGRVFRYAKAGAAISTTTLAASFASAVKISYEALTGTTAIGSRILNMTEASITEDQLQGGYAIIYKASGSVYVRGITGNSASASADDTLQIYLDAALPVALDTSDAAEIMLNPYVDLRQTDLEGLASFAGMPATAAASGAYFWVQTWGPCWAAPQATVAAAAFVREVYFRHDGSLDVRDTIGTFVTDQRAGFVLDYSPSGQGPPLVMLQVSP